MLNKVKKILESKDAKILLENFFSLGALQTINLILPLVVLPYIIRVVGLSLYGVIVLATSLVTYFVSVTDYSFKITATRDVVTFPNNPLKLNIIYSKVIIVKSLLLFISWLLIATIVILYPPFYEERTVFFLTATLLLGNMLFPDWFFQGIEKMRYIALLNVSIKVFFTIGVFIFIRAPEDYWKYPLLNSMGYIGAGVAAQYILVKKYKLSFIWLKPRIIFHTLRDNFAIFINQFLPNLYNNTSTFLLGIFAATYFVGVYDAIKKVVDVVISIISVISRVSFPFLNRRRDKFEYYKKWMMRGCIILIIGMLTMFRPLIWLLKIDFEGAFWVYLILSIGVFFYLMYDVFGVNYFIIRRKDKLVMKNTLNASLIGFFTSLPLIFFWGILGAALNLSLTRAIMGLGLYRKYKLQKK